MGSKRDEFFDTRELSDDDGEGKVVQQGKGVLGTADLLPPMATPTLPNQTTRTTTTTTTTTIKKTLLMTADQFHTRTISSTAPQIASVSEGSVSSASDKVEAVDSKDAVQHLNKQLYLFQKNNTQFYNLLTMINESLDANFGGKIPAGTDILAKINALAEFVNLLESKDSGNHAIKTQGHENKELRAQLDALQRKILDAESVLTAKESEIKNILQTSMANLDTVRSENYRLTKLNIHVIEERQKLQDELDIALKKSNDCMAQYLAQENLIEELQLSCKLLEKKVKSLEAGEQDKKTASDEIAKLRGEITSLEQQVCELELQLNDRDQRISKQNLDFAELKAKSAQDAAHDVAKTKEALSETALKAAALQTQVDSLTDELLDCKKQLAVQVSASTDWAKKYSENQLHIGELEAEILRLNEELAKISNEDKSVSETLALKETLLQEVTTELTTLGVKFDVERAGMQKEIEQLKTDFAKKHEAFETLSKKLAKVEPRAQACADKEVMIQSLRETIKQLKGEVQALHTAKTDVEDSFSQLVTAKDVLEEKLAKRIAELEAIRVDRKSLEERIFKLQSSLTDSEKLIEVKEAALADAAKASALLQLELTKMKGDAQVYSEKSKSLLAEKAALEEKVKSLTAADDLRMQALESSHNQVLEQLKQENSNYAEQLAMLNDAMNALSLQKEDTAKALEKLKASKDVLERDLKEAKHSIEQQKKSYETLHKESNAKWDLLDAELRSRIKELEGIAKARENTIQQASEKHFAKTKDLETLLVDKEALNASLESALAEVRAKLEAATSHEESLQDQVKQVQTSLRDEQVAREKLESDLAVKISEVEEKEREKVLLHSQLQALIKEQKDAASAMLTVASASNKAEKLEGELKECKEQLEAYTKKAEVHKKIIKERDVQLFNLKAQLKESQSSVLSLNGQLNGVQELRDAHDKLRDEYELNQVKLTSVNDAHESSLTHISDMSTKIEELEREIEPLRAFKRQKSVSIASQDCQTEPLPTADRSVATDSVSYADQSSATDTLQVDSKGTEVDAVVQASGTNFSIPQRTMSQRNASENKTTITKTITTTTMQAFSAHVESSVRAGEVRIMSSGVQTDFTGKSSLEPHVIEASLKGQQEAIYDLLGTVDVYEKMAKDYERVLSENENRRVKIMVWKPIVESYEKARLEWQRQIDYYKDVEFDLRGTVDAQTLEMYRLRDIEMESEYRRVKAMIYKQLALTHEVDDDSELFDTKRRLEHEQASNATLVETAKTLEDRLTVSKNRIEQLLQRVQELAAAKDQAFLHLNKIESQMLTKSASNKVKISHSTQTAGTPRTDAKVQTLSKVANVGIQATRGVVASSGEADLKASSVMSLNGYRERLYQLEERVISQLDDISQLEFELVKMRVTMSQDNEKIAKLEQELRRFRDYAARDVGSETNSSINKSRTTTVHVSESSENMYPYIPSIKRRDGSLIHHPFFYSTETDLEKDELIQALQERLLSLEEQNNKQGLALRRIQERLLLGVANGSSGTFEKNSSNTSVSHSNSEGGIATPPLEKKVNFSPTGLSKVKLPDSQNFEQVPFKQSGADKVTSKSSANGLPTPMVSPVLPNVDAKNDQPLNFGSEGGLQRFVSTTTTTTTNTSHAVLAKKTSSEV